MLVAVITIVIHMIHTQRAAAPSPARAWRCGCARMKAGKDALTASCSTSLRARPRGVMQELLYGGILPTDKLGVAPHPRCPIM